MEALKTNVFMSVTLDVTGGGGGGGGGGGVFASPTFTTCGYSEKGNLSVK